MRLRRSRTEPAYRRELRHDEWRRDESDLGVRRRVPPITTRREPAPPLPTLAAAVLQLGEHEEEEVEEAAICKVHYYGDNASIFSDMHEAHSAPIFTTQKRLLPWEEYAPTPNPTHAYSAHLADDEPRVLPSWRVVRGETRRRRPPTPSPRC